MDRERERKVVRWLASIQEEAEAIYLLGDLFDFWFEYKRVVPKGHLRFLGKLAELSDGGVPIHIFSGNHDAWMFGYLEDELNLTIQHRPLSIELKGKKFYLGHGDGLGPGDHGYKFMKKIFRAPFNQWLFARLHPNFGLGVMQRFSSTSREAQKDSGGFLGADKEWLVQFCEEHQKEDPHDYYIFGHRHWPIDHLLSDGRGRYINCGEWITQYEYVVYDGHSLTLQKYTE